MKYLSLFSGIEAASVAWEPLGWEPVAFAEIEKFPSAVLAHHYPDVPNLGDITQVDWRQYAGVDVLVGGSPCQSFSVAGLRKGLADPRGNLALEYLRAVDAVRPRWVVWENVPGVLSSWSGPNPPSDLEPGQRWESEEASDFGCFLDGLRQLGYGFAYRVLDAQYVRVESHARAVPQRRRRVFVVGHLGDWRRAAAVLFERESVRGNPAPRREAGEGSTQDATCGTLCSRTGLARGVQEAEGGHIVAFADVSRTKKRQNGPGFTDSGCAFTLTAGDTPGVLTAVSFSAGNSDKAYGIGYSVEHTPPLRAADSGTNQVPTIAQGYAVRRLTPLECERLQGFPDGWTDVPYRNKQASDGPRYKAIGNSMATNVMRFIGERIAIVDKQAEIYGTYFIEGER